MPAKSIAQQRFMGMVHAVQKGKMKAPSKKIEETAKSMKKQDVTDFAKTKHENLPAKKEAQLSLMKVANVLTNIALIKAAELPTDKIKEILAKFKK